MDPWTGTEVAAETGRADDTRALILPKTSGGHTQHGSHHGAGGHVAPETHHIVSSSEEVSPVTSCRAREEQGGTCPPECGMSSAQRLSRPHDAETNGGWGQGAAQTQ